MSEPSLRERLLSAPGKPAGQLTHSSAPAIIHLRRLTLRDRMRVQEISGQTEANPFERLASMVRLFAGDESNRPIFDDTLDGIAASLELPGDVADAIVEQGLTANGLGVGVAEAGKANSPPTTN